MGWWVEDVGSYRKKHSLIFSQCTEKNHDWEIGTHLQHKSDSIVYNYNFYTIAQDIDVQQMNN